MKYLIAALAMCSANALVAQDNIVVSSPTLSEWVERTNEKLGRAIDSTRPSLSEQNAFGITYVAFECSEDGRPTDIAVSEPGNRALDRLGVRIVKRMKSMHPLHAGFKHGQKYEAAIVIARNQEELEKGEAIVAQRAKRANEQWAARGMKNPVFALYAPAK